MSVVPTMKHVEKPQGETEMKLVQRKTSLQEEDNLTTFKRIVNHPLKNQ